MKGVAVLLFVTGQLIDLLTTVSAKRRFPGRIKEVNPFFAKDVADRNWDRLLIWKIIGCTFSLGFIWAVTNFGDKEARKLGGKAGWAFLSLGAIISWTAVFNNLLVYRRLLFKERQNQQ